MKVDTQRDSITDLLNYAHTREYISDYISEPGASGAVLMIDIDNFQQLNESLGYVFGDQVIVSVSKILMKAFLSTDIIGRLSGDRFLVFVKGQVPRDFLALKGNEICSEAQKIYCGEHLLKNSVSIGIASLNVGDTFDDLCEKAEQALYFAKGKGKNFCQFYEEDMAVIGSAFKRRHTTNRGIAKDSYDIFYNEIAEMTFRLMEDTTDADASILLLLKKIKEQFGFSVVSVQDVVEEKTRTLKYVYNLVSEGISNQKNQEIQYEKEEWLRMKSKLERGRYLFQVATDSPEGREIFSVAPECRMISGLRLPLGKKEYFNGIANFIYVGEEHEWEEREIRFLESFTRILSVYMNRIKTFDEAQYLAQMMREHDSVTGLFSYETFLRRMKEYVEVLKEPCEIVYTYSDFSNFRYINETYGYEVGNLLLRKFGEFVTADENEDILCASRLHSDNIVVARKNTEKLTPQEFAEQIDACNEYLAEILKQYGHDSMLHIRSGIYFSMSNEGTIEEAVTNAGYACKKNKDSGSDKCTIFTEDMLKEYKKRLRYIRELDAAMENGELQVYIQPKSLTKNNEVVGGEALIRWIKPGNEVIFPGDFIPVFEKSGDIITLDYFVYRKVCEYIRGRMDAGLPVVPISVNVSTLHLKDDDIMVYLEQLLEEYKIPMDYLELELTESVYIDDVGQALRLLSWCKEKGIRMAMDDFGAGYSSLNILDVVPIDIMKIDRIFMKNQNLTENDKIILECVVNMADKLDITTICEGVENAEQLCFLRKIGCDIIQGYFIGKPMPMAAFDKFLEENTIATEIS
ncbi:MAG: EAL domain-containing protein [Lachnospiraceae bacterium]|nr:EAL domain-containing protein [Lachnospiraceae bacterium]